LTIFQGSVPPGLERLKIGHVWLSFAPKTYLPYSVRSSYRFAISTAENVSVEFWPPFRARGPPVQSKLKIGSGWLTFDSWSIPKLFGTHFLPFLFVRVKTVSDKFLRLFLARARPEHEKWKPGARWLGLAPETYPQFLGCNSYHLPSVRQQNVSVEFWWLYWAGHHRCSQSSKSSPN